MARAAQRRRRASEVPLDELPRMLMSLPAEDDSEAVGVAEKVAAIGVQLPQHLFVSDIYTEHDTLHQQKHAPLFFARHRDHPAHLIDHAHTYLFSAEQRRELAALFAPGWQDDAASPVHALVGTCRSSSSHRVQAYDEYAVRDASVGTFCRKVESGKQLVVSDVPLHSVAPSLARGPALFQHANMLTVAPIDTATTATQNHLLCFAIFATAGSYTAPHLDYFGMDAYLYLVSGEKLWLLAPPEKEREFNTLFQRDNRGATIRLSSAEKQFMKQHRMRAIHQRAGEVVYLPSGWPHMVKNLTDTVSFGNSYLRPWRMDAFLSFVKQHGLTYASRLVHVVAVVRAWMDEEQQRQWGVTTDEATHIMHKWGTWIKTHVVPAAVAADDA